MNFGGFIAVFLLVLSGINASNSLEKYRERCLNRNSLYVIPEEDEEYEDNELKTVGSVPFANFDVKDYKNTNKRRKDECNDIQNSQSEDVVKTDVFIPPFVRTGSFEDYIVTNDRSEEIGENREDLNNINTEQKSVFSFGYEEETDCEVLLSPSTVSMESIEN